MWSLSPANSSRVCARVEGAMWMAPGRDGGGKGWDGGKSGTVAERACRARVSSGGGRQLERESMCVGGDEAATCRLSYRW